MESIVGKILGDRYRIAQELSKNPLSVVYLAEDIEQGTLVACEVEQLSRDYFKVDDSLQSWQQAQKTFLAQGYLLKSLSQHPQIPTLWDFFVCEGEFYLIREHVVGQSLEQQLAEALLTEAEAGEWLQEIADILQFVHNQGGGHLNIQPSSLFLAQDGSKLLTNFSLLDPTKLAQQEPPLPQQFAPPNSMSCSAQARDIYALGKTIIYALSGSLGDEIQAKSLSIVDAQKLPANSQVVVADINPKLARVLNKMVREYPETGYQTFAEVIIELDHKQDVVVFPPPFVNSHAPSKKPARRKKSRRSFGKGRSSSKKSAKRKSHRSIDKTARNSRLMPEIIWLGLSLPFIIALLIVTVGIRRDAYKDFEQYSNQEYKFQVKYPASWSQRQLDDPITGDVVLFATPPESSMDLFQERVQISVENLPADIQDLEQYAQMVLQRIQEGQASEVEFFEEFRSNIDRSPSKTVIYSRQEDSLDLRQMEIFTIKNDQVYIATYTAERAKFSKFYGSVEKLISSWKIQ